MSRLDGAPRRRVFRSLLTARSSWSWAAAWWWPIAVASAEPAVAGEVLQGDAAKETSAPLVPEEPSDLETPEEAAEITEGDDPDVPPPLYDVRRNRPQDSAEGCAASAAGDCASSGDASASGRAGSASSRVDAVDLPRAPEEELDYRYAGVAGVHLNLADSELAGYGNGLGGGFHFAFLAAPKSWPVLFGAQLGLETYGGPLRAGRRYVLTSYSVLAAVRLQPDEWSVRPHLDLFGGLWGLDVGVPSRNQTALIDARATVGGRATWVVGAGVGVDFIWGRYMDFDYGIGFGVQAWHGGYMQLPDPYGFGQRESQAIRAFLFTIDLVGVSRGPKSDL